MRTPGRTGGGGTGITDMIIQSGREKRGSKPRALASSSLIRFNISSAFSAVMSCPGQELLVGANGRSEKHCSPHRTQDQDNSYMNICKDVEQQPSTWWQ